ncbi:MAG: FHA domain-containing protein [Planctomycetota bacterium]
MGAAGFVKGEEYPLPLGATVVIGRSRSCDISLQRCKTWLETDEQTRSTDQDFKTVSRKHARISCYDPENVEVEDLSSNGTFVDGERVDRIVLSDLRERSHELLLGTREAFRLEWRPED